MSKNDRALADKVIKEHTFYFDEKNKGGESLSLRTKIIANGDPNGYFYNQELKLQSYCNSASIELCGTSITPECLRKLADELEEAELEALNIINKIVLAR